ncbi:hypothetical protein D0D70_05475 [Vibrio parahaemolyticus]|uniref:hypothetical protein n=7 Tax=Vibrio parahaemolyticus TaxID=670 RepID=UPI00112497D4|nr:hypothetical protein [Vibrio parahaemolyticus]EGR1575947.1 hypothetical protein [Vibrio parahaemolyticus]MDF5090160.1 hypothetical protein [Vibrio parahaemolyticus]MDF5134873.1 hypothetical protein [Vibrio parahaemolyticus]MDF5281702.1 hypothetical protein [Vibrio parahaemolyticus]NMU23655.1 hypothetical protein [Vibrio parahaemolyticus]
MKQVDFIKLLSNKLPEIFKTEQLLLVLLESSSENLELHEVRKCMHNHLQRLEKQNLVERLCPKRTRNASFKRLFHFDSINLSLLGSYSEQAKFSESASHSHLFKQHVQKLKHDTSTLSKKRDVFSKLTEDYKMYEPLIRRKLSELDSAILDKKIELEAISELMNAINCTGASETQRTSPV